MTDAERAAEWLHYAGLLQTDGARGDLLFKLRRDSAAGDRAAGQALRELLRKWFGL